MKKTLLPVLFFFLIFPVLCQTIYPVPAAEDTTSFGAGIQRTMNLLATSAAAKKNTVKILVYGQSISKQDWWLDVKSDLQTRFPNANLTMINRSIGGFSSAALSNPAEFDITSFYPDLIIFHVYKTSNTAYEGIIKSIRTKTTAEIAIQSDHVTTSTNAGTISSNNNQSYIYLPDLCQKYGLEMMEIRKPWYKYLSDNSYVPSKLLSDDVHLNMHGNYVLATFIKRHLAYKPKFPSDPNGLVRTYEVGKDVSFVNEKLTLPFSGNKVDLISSASTGASATVMIDEKKPSEFPGCYYFTRPNDVAGKDWPWQIGSIVKLNSAAPLKAEDWTVTIDKINAKGDTFDFSLSGSVTGPDGSGKNYLPFTSNSKRIVLGPESWFISRAINEVYKIPISAGFQIKWSVLGMFNDTFTPVTITDSSKETVTTIAQGIPNQNHTLVLTAQGSETVPIKYIRVYRPLSGRDASTEVEDIKLSNSVKLYPNPSSELIRLYLPENHRTISLKVFDLTGREVAQLEENNLQASSFELNVSSFPEGIYTLKILLNDRWIGKKFSVVK